MDLLGGHDARQQNFLMHDVDVGHESGKRRGAVHAG